MQIHVHVCEEYEIWGFKIVLIIYIFLNELLNSFESHAVKLRAVVYNGSGRVQ